MVRESKTTALRPQHRRTQTHTHIQSDRLQSKQTTTKKYTQPNGYRRARTTTASVQPAYGSFRIPENRESFRNAIKCIRLSYEAAFRSHRSSLLSTYSVLRVSVYLCLCLCTGHPAHTQHRPFHHDFVHSVSVGHTEPYVAAFVLRIRYNSIHASVFLHSWIFVFVFFRFYCTIRRCKPYKLAHKIYIFSA